MTTEISTRAKSSFLPMPAAPPMPERSDNAMSDWIRDYFFRDQFCYNSVNGWMFFDGKRWTTVDRVQIIEYVSQAISCLNSRAIAGGASSRDLSYIASLATKNKITAITDLCRGRVYREPELFDSSPDLLNAQNGVVDLRTGELLPHSSSFNFTQLAGAAYIANARHADVDSMFEALDTPEVDWLQACLGQGITGHMTPDDKLVIWVGGGSNGKSSIINGVSSAAGDYACNLPEKTLLANPSDHSTELMPLRGARLAFMEELPEGKHLPVKRLKDLTGTPQITAREVNKNNVTWYASHSIFISTNYPPIVDEVDDGTWRRIKMLEFKKRFVKPESVREVNDRVGDPDLRRRLQENSSGQLEAILAWLVAGAIRYYENGRTLPEAPESVAHTTEAWRKDGDKLLAFFEEEIEVDPDSFIAVGDLVSVFNQRMELHGNSEWGETKFNTRFKAHDSLRPYFKEKKRIRSGANGRSLPPFPTVPVSTQQFQCWVGIKFRGGDTPTI